MVCPVDAFSGVMVGLSWSSVFYCLGQSCVFICEGLGFVVITYMVCLSCLGSVVWM